MILALAFAIPVGFIVGFIIVAYQLDHAIHEIRRVGWRTYRRNRKIEEQRRMQAERQASRPRPVPVTVAMTNGRMHITRP